MIAFNSLQYIAFLAIVLSFYWLIKNRRGQNALLLLASYIFYASWDWRFLSLILISTFLDFFAGKRIFESIDKTTRRGYLFLSVIGNLTILGVFKYFNFFIDSLVHLLNILGWQTPPMIFNIVLPIGISFYTFQTMSYSLDIYHGKLKPTTSLLSFSLFVAFFPQLVAGPIERARRMIPQFKREQKFRSNRFFHGLDLIVWGLLKKVFIADNIATYVNMIFNLTSPSTLLILTGAIGFGIQIYCDFSAYTDIAKGSANLFSFNLSSNFIKPYLSQNIIQFWRRWHISLSYWIRDYIYIPLGGSRCSNLRYVFNVFVTWFLCGLWHGAQWHFVAWGVLHGTYLWLIVSLFDRFSKTFISLV